MFKNEEISLENANYPIVTKGDNTLVTIKHDGSTVVICDDAVTLRELFEYAEDNPESCKCFVNDVDDLGNPTSYRFESLFPMFMIR